MDLGCPLLRGSSDCRLRRRAATVTLWCFEVFWCFLPACLCVVSKAWNCIDLKAGEAPYETQLISVKMTIKGKAIKQPLDKFSYRNKIPLTLKCIVGEQQLPRLASTAW